MIRFSHVSHIYDNQFVALNDVSFEIKKGEFVFLTGKSGAGKTTLLKHIYMEELPSTGTVEVSRFDSKSIRKKPKHIALLRQEIGIVFQDFRLLWDRTVYDNVAFSMRAVGARERTIKKRVFEVLALTGLSHKRAMFPAQLSGGEQQRVCIARAIVNTPWLVIADEPTGNLDQGVSQDIFNLFQEINSWGTTILMATHDLFLLNQYPYRQMVLSQGSLTQGSQSPNEIYLWSHT